MSYGISLAGRRYGELEKLPCSGKTCESDLLSGVQTPVSLAPRNRTLPINYSFSLTESLLLEPISNLYGQCLNNQCGIKVGHFAGAISLIWFSPWAVATNILGGAINTASVALNVPACFLRYTLHLVKAASLSPRILVLALFYIFRFRERCPDPFIGAPTSEARLLVTALMIADKYENDVSYANSTWAKVSNIPAQELRKMETEFLLGIDFQLHLTPGEWNQFCGYLSAEIFPTVDRLVSI